MFGLIRLPLFIAAAFLAGVFYERNAHLELCEEAGGEVVARLCDGGTR